MPYGAREAGGKKWVATAPRPRGEANRGVAGGASVEGRWGLRIGTAAFK